MAAHLTTAYPLKQGDTKTQVANLQQVVTSLIDELQHILYNLDSGNVLEAATVKKLKAGSVTAEAISQSYQAEVRDAITGSAGELRQEFTAADGRLESEITYISAENEEMSSRIEQTEDEISLQAKKINEALSATAQNSAAIAINSEAISGVVTKKMSFEGATRRETLPTADNTTEEEKERLYFCTTGSTYYYWNEISGEWRETESESIYSAFIQTADGFELNADLVKISGDLISGGTIAGTTVSTSANIFGDSVQLNSDTQSLELYYSGVQIAAWVPGNGASSLYPVNGAELRISGVTASGDWDFSNCTNIEWGSNAPAGGGGSVSETKDDGWVLATEADGGDLKHFSGGGHAFTFGMGFSGSGYTEKDLVLRAESTAASRVVFDMTDSGYREVNFVGLNEGVAYNPYILANGYLLATQDYVRYKAEDIAGTVCLTMINNSEEDMRDYIAEQLSYGVTAVYA